MARPSLSLPLYRTDTLLSLIVITIPVYAISLYRHDTARERDTM